MKFIRNVKAISGFFLILLLLLATIVGAILSYLWVIGYYVSLERVYPEDITVNITGYAFDYQNTSFFNVTIQNPTSYKSKETANITQIVVSTGDGVLHDNVNTDPSLPYKFQHKGEVETFKCLWNWANFTGETVKIIAFVADGSGPTFEVETPLVRLEITDIRFNSTISVTHFNITVQNSMSSVTFVNITEVTLDEELVLAQNLSIPLPYGLDPDESVSFNCKWNWTNLQGKNVTVAVHTAQRYSASRTIPTPEPVDLAVTDVIFSVTNTTRFNATVLNSEDSPTYVNITRIAVGVENQTVREWTLENGTEVEPTLPHFLNSSSLQTFSCPWNWTDQREKNVTVTIYTSQGFMARYVQVTPAPVILEVTNTIFNPLETGSFNVTVKNSESSIKDANITEITVILENGISININMTDPPLLPTILNPGEAATFNCTWNWAAYSGKNVTIVVNTPKYSIESSPILLKALAITDILFNSLDTAHFIITVQNPTELSFSITGIEAKIVGGDTLNITDVKPGTPFILPSGTSPTFISFMLSSDWKVYQGEDVTVSVETSEGFTASRTYRIPSV